MGRYVIQRLALAAVIAATFGSMALAQNPLDFSSVERSSKFLTAHCNTWRVSESRVNKIGFKLLGRSTKGICRDVAAKWSRRFVEWHRAKDSSAPLRAFFEICREVAEKLVERPLEIVRCSSWEQVQGGRAILIVEPPKEGTGTQRPSRDELLRGVLERRLPKDWDQIRVKNELEWIGFACEASDRNRKRGITTTTPEIACSADASEVVSAPGKPLSVHGLKADVLVKFAKSGEPRGWQQMEVRTGGSFALQIPPDPADLSLVAKAGSQYVTKLCEAWRASESPLDSRARKLLGKASDSLCREVAEKWSGRFVEMVRTKDGAGPLRALPEICRDIAEKLAGRPVEVVWCSGAPGLPDEFWAALDGSPFEGIAAEQSRRDEALRAAVERRLGKDWDQLRVKADLEAIGFDCGVWNGRGERDRNITTSTPRFTCTTTVSEIAGAPSRPLLLFNTQINVELKFAEPGGARGWQQIEVKTGEAHL